MDTPKIFIALIAALLLPAAGAFADTVSDYGHAIQGFTGVSGRCAADWISLESAVIPVAAEFKRLDEIEMLADYIRLAGEGTASWPSFLTPDHPLRFISLAAESPVQFSALFFDGYGNTPAPGYPKVVFWPAENAQPVELLLSQTGVRDGRALYQVETSLPPGVYHYRYEISTLSFPYECPLETGTVVVTHRPGGFRDICATGDPLPNGCAMLRWEAADPDGETLTYRLFAGEDPDRLSLIYEGTAPCCTITSLGYGCNYYWQVEAIDPNGASALSPVYMFATTVKAASAFNYPNPFNPAREATAIVLDMEEDGQARLAVYTEFGDLCWQRTIALPRGTNAVPYAGTDDAGRILYNGTYVCIIEKEYARGSTSDRCRILVVK